MKDIRISAKNLAPLNMPDACPRCFWIKNKCKVPFQIFPGIFSTLDSYSKKVVEAWRDKNGHLPRWMAPYCNAKLLKVPHWSKFTRTDPETGITLHGGMDLYLEYNGAHGIDDFKTAKITENQDKLRPLYDAQLNGYQWIDEGLGHEVAWRRLIYCEPIPFENVENVVMASGFDMHFKVVPVDIPHYPDLIPDLLKAAKKILDLEFPPPGAKGCDDCAKLDGIMNSLNASNAAQPQAA